MNNCYYLNPIGAEDGGTKMTLEQFKSGEVCFKLNVDQSDIHWYQNIGEDEFPVLDITHKTVVFDDVNGYHNAAGDDEDGISLTPALSKGEGAIYDLSGRKIDSSRFTLRPKASSQLLPSEESIPPPVTTTRRLPSCLKKFIPFLRLQK